VVNRAARAQSVAKTGEILVTSAVRNRIGGVISGRGHDYMLKGFREPVTLFQA
jgi:adenylate cyclase